MMTDREEELARLLLLEQQHGELNDADRNRLIALSERIPDKEEELLRTMATLGQAPPLPAPVTPPTAVQSPPLPAPVTPQKPVSAGRPTFTRRRLIGAGIGMATAGAVWFALSGNEPVAQALEQPPGFPPESSPPLQATPSGYG